MNTEHKELPMIRLARMIRNGTSKSAVNRTALQMGLPLDAVEQIRADIRLYGRPQLRTINADAGALNIEQQKTKGTKQ